MSANGNPTGNEQGLLWPDLGVGANPQQTPDPRDNQPPTEQASDAPGQKELQFA